MAKAKADLSLTGAVNEVYDFFFETAEDIIQAITPEKVDDGKRIDVEQPKRAKPVGDTFITEEKGKKDKRGKGGDGVSEPDSEKSGDDGADE